MASHEKIILVHTDHHVVERSVVDGSVCAYELREPFVWSREKWERMREDARKLEMRAGTEKHFLKALTPLILGPQWQVEEFLDASFRKASTSNLPAPSPFGSRGFACSS
jgi:hypothetical protein